MRDGVEFGVLGPLRISAADAELAITSPRSRTFLALLVLNAGRQVSLYEFADAIWGAALPQNPRRAVQLCAVRVRAQLERIGSGELVVTCPDGYRLDVASEHTDVGRVAALVRDADAASDSDAELKAVTAALALWRGEPLADVPSEALQREVVPGLREQQLQLTERRVDILLRSESAADLVDELVTLTARHPLRERLWGQLMRALQHLGRRGEALTAFHTFRRRLRDELGIDPSPDLKALHASILTSQSEPGTEAASPSLRVPRELPTDPAAFAGRVAELSELDLLLAASEATPQPAVGVITGTAGVGKTSLAIHWARRVADDFPDGQLFVNMRGYHPEQALTPQRVLARFLRTLGVRGQDLPEDIDELTAMYRSVMDGRRMLIVLDNVNHSDQARPLLPGAAGCLVVITSRDVLLSLIAADNASQISLDLPDTADARRMLARRLGSERLSSEPGAADDIIAASARLPLALAIAAARAVINKDTRLSAVAEQLRAGLDAFDTASPMTDVRAVFSWSYQALSPDAARLLRLLGLHPGSDVSAAAVASFAGLSPSHTDRLLAELVRAHLVIGDVPGRYALHDLMREYAVELANAEDSEADRDLAFRRLLDHYVHTGRTAATLLNPYWRPLALDDAFAGVHPEDLADYDAAMDWFAAERDVLIAVLDWAVSAGFDRQIVQLVWVLAGYLERQGPWTQWASTHRDAIAAAQRLGEPVLEARAHRGLGLANLRMSRIEDAHRHFARALELYRDSDDLEGMARAESALALVREEQRRYPEALEHALRALEHQKRIGGGVGYANAHNTVGWCHALVGQYDEALDHGGQALAEHRAVGNPVGEAATLDTIGFAHHHLGQFAEAIDSYREALRLYRQLGDRYFIACALDHLGDTYEALGDRASSLDMWREAVSTLDGLTPPETEQVRAKLRGAAFGSG
ncbi:AfsR/SARP family transcriptional regulator [Stackebrandtia nassauensis]|uniref:Transcriptional regulator, SARP family n=1 Tax=Stackebrandtia nassauensis (strain DSM 44728 / CIP 108903 / NRRL B-16338 / NBRC 102104 / LLR-40K-21) TaxID=446470 RepID=D3Q6D8_STANL|nr:BTAD domain-containing putative transcriptional regulator [Stackebrandtia nassauensis]ADD42313.1 transcriptional regulator, SARP family [Stackebrandtia nassauensis DSM 44728]